MKTLWQLWCETWGVLAIIYIGAVGVMVHQRKKEKTKTSPSELMGKELNELILKDNTARQTRATVMINRLMTKNGYLKPDIDRIMHFVDTGEDD